MNSILLLAAERLRQITTEGYSQNNDDNYWNNELADAAICYLADPNLRDSAPFVWPWSEESFKPSVNRMSELIKAGALVLAAIDREQRKNEEFDKEFEQQQYNDLVSILRKLSNQPEFITSNNFKIGRNFLNSHYQLEDTLELEDEYVIVNRNEWSQTVQFLNSIKSK